jgi:hypothetical protein
MLDLHQPENNNVRTRVKNSQQTEARMSLAFLLGGTAEYARSRRPKSFKNKMEFDSAIGTTITG